MENIEIFLFDQARDLSQPARASKRVFQVYGCVVTCQDMVEHKDPTKVFDKVSYGFVSSLSLSLPPSFLRFFIGWGRSLFYLSSYPIYETTMICLLS
jgi:hypothetical protein